MRHTKLTAVTAYPNTGWPPKCGNQDFKVEHHSTNESFFANSQHSEPNIKIPNTSLEDMIIQARNLLITLDVRSERSENKLRDALILLGEVESIVRTECIRINTIFNTNRA